MYRNGQALRKYQEVPQTILCYHTLCVQINFDLKLRTHFQAPIHLTFFRNYPHDAILNPMQIKSDIIKNSKKLVIHFQQKCTTSTVADSKGGNENANK